MEYCSYLVYIRTSWVNHFQMTSTLMTWSLDLVTWYDCQHYFYLKKKMVMYLVHNSTVWPVFSTAMQEFNLDFHGNLLSRSLWSKHVLASTNDAIVQ